MIAAISIIIPTYKEVSTLPHLIKALCVLEKEYQIELLIMDDNSQDGTEELIHSLNLPWVRLIVRHKDRGLSPAVIEGFTYAKHEIIVVMDADLSHPPEAIPKMVELLHSQYDFVIGSRYVSGASTDLNWSFFRYINSKVACLLAAPLTSIKDPMSGFFAFKKSLLDSIKNLNPVGYKICLELLVKSHSTKVIEIPIHFKDREFGETKLSIWEQLKYIKHLRRLFLYSYPETSYLLQFMAIGFLGIFVNLFFLTIALREGFEIETSIIIGIGASIVSNFVLDRRFAFSYARQGKISSQFLGFVAVCLIGAFINFHIAMAILTYFPSTVPQIAELAGIFIATFFNYSICRFFIFNKDQKSRQSQNSP